MNFLAFKCRTLSVGISTPIWRDLAVYGDQQIERPFYGNPTWTRASLSSTPTTLCGYDLTICFNPATIMQPNNAVVEDVVNLAGSLERLRVICQELELSFDPARISICEVHLARDCWFFGVNSETEKDLETEVSNCLRVFEWGQPRRARGS